MSDNIPYEIQLQILKRLPIKSIIQYRSVCKPWKSLIDSSKFVTDYNFHDPQHRLLVSYFGPKSYDQKYISIMDNDHSFPQHKFPINAPMQVKLLNEKRLIGSSHGLFCFHNFDDIELRDSRTNTYTAVVWNPAIQKSVSVGVPNVLLDWPYETVIGFGVCPGNFDPKLVKIIYFLEIYHQDYANITPIPWQVEVFSLSLGAWRAPLCSSNNLPRKSIELTKKQVAIDRFIYWLACDRFAVDGERHGYDLILSFDMETEEFTEICLPDILATHDTDKSLLISKLRESLVVLDSSQEAEKRVYGVWMMENDVQSSFTKLFTIKAPDVSIERVLAFRKSGEPIVEIKKDCSGEDAVFVNEFCAKFGVSRNDFVFKNQNALFVYEPCSENINGIPIPINGVLSFAISYDETLLLLDY